MHSVLWVSALKTMKLYHYTNKKAYDAILNDRRILESKDRTMDAVHGAGTYLTPLDPSHKKEEIAKESYNDGRAAGKALRDGKLDYWFEFDLDEALFFQVS